MERKKNTRKRTTGLLAMLLAALFVAASLSGTAYAEEAVVEDYAAPAAAEELPAVQEDVEDDVFYIEPAEFMTPTAEPVEYIPAVQEVPETQYIPEPEPAIPETPAVQATENIQEPETSAEPVATQPAEESVIQDVHDVQNVQDVPVSPSEEVIAETAPAEEAATETETTAEEKEETEEELSDLLPEAVQALYTINGVGLPLKNYAAGAKVDDTFYYNYGYSCWAFSQMVYEQIWAGKYGNFTMGLPYTPAKTDNDNMLRGIINCSDLTITAAHTRAFISKAALGAVIRVTDDIDDNDYDGGVFCHSMILVAKSSTGFTVYHGNWDGKVAFTTFTWTEFVNTFKNYKYFKYIKWPGAPAYDPYPTSSALYTINGVNLPLKGYTAGTILNDDFYYHYGYACWAFTQLVYEHIWAGQYNSYYYGLAFTPDRKDEDNMLRNIDNLSELAITAKNTKKYISEAKLGAVIRLSTSLDNATFDDGEYKHSMILVAKSSTGFTVYHGNWDGGVVAFTTFTWAGFANTFKDCRYFKYIKWPGAGTEDSTAEIAGTDDDADIYTDEMYCINDVYLPLADYHPGKALDNSFQYNYGSGCWAFSQMVYEKIWAGRYADYAGGIAFTPNRKDSDNMLRNIDDLDSLAITAESTRTYISAASPGAVIRVSDSINETDYDGGRYAHSMILVAKDSLGFTVYHANLDGKIAMTTYSWSGFAAQFKEYKYFKYIKWPDAPECTTTATVTLKAPQGLKVSVSTTGIKLTWNAVAGCTGYKIYRSTPTTGFSLIATISGQQTTEYKDTSATKANTAYTYKIIATKGSVTSRESDAVTQLFYNAPEITGMSNKAGGVELVWKASSPAPRYYIFRKVPSGSWVKLGYTSETTYTDTTAVSGKTYYYTVRCADTTGAYLSGFLTSAKRMFLASPTLSAVKPSSGGNVLTWTKVNGASGYQIYRRTSTATTWTKIATVSGGSVLTYTDASSKGNTKYKYYYEVRAYNGSYVGAISNKRATYPAPVISSTKTVSTGIKITWGAVSGISKYRVYRKTNGGKWVAIATTSLTSYTDKTAKKGNAYQYTVRCLGTNGTTLVSWYKAGTNKKY